MKKVILFFVAILSISAAFGQMEVDQKKESDALMEVNRQWAEAASPEQFFSYIAKDALMMAPDKGIIQGHEGIGIVLAEYQSLPGFAITWEPQSAYVSESGDLGYSVDLILVSFNDEKGKKVELYEKGVTIWKKDVNNNWKMAVDIWNIDKTITSIKS